VATATRWFSPAMTKMGQIRSSVVSRFSRISLRDHSDWRTRRILVAGNPEAGNSGVAAAGRWDAVCSASTFLSMAGRSFIVPQGVSLSASIRAGNSLSGANIQMLLFQNEIK
jgi:hypothetical protein